jgi:hypothetical protein
MPGRTNNIPLPRFSGGWPAATAERTVTVAELRDMITAARPEILAAGARTARRMELFHELHAILVELSLEAPDLAPVRQHWKRVRHLLGPVAGSGRIAQVTEMLIALFPTSRRSSPAADGPADDGPANDGPVNDGPVNDGTAHGTANDDPADGGPADGGPAATIRRGEPGAGPPHRS